MAENSAISWTDHTFNGWWGCTKVGPGCDHCYAEALDKRFGGHHWGSGAPRRLVKDWSLPRKWNREAERTGIRPWVFSASMSDVFDNEVPTEWRDRLWALISETPYLNWILVTKRIGNASKMVPADWPEAFPHVGLCVTVCNQEEADRDIPKLLATPAAWRGVSAEPLLGPIDFDCILWPADRPRFPDTDDLSDARSALRMIEGSCLDWVIVGGESGAHARPMSIQWAREIRDQCASADVSFHFKHWGEWTPAGSQPSETPGRFAFGDYSHDRTHMVLTNRYPRQFTMFGAMSVLQRVGKKSAGRLLDGVEHNGMPSLNPAGARS